ncbi:MAG: hypothetical protein ACP5UA_00005 [Candidatus Hydrogenedens sp.]
MIICLYKERHYHTGGVWCVLGTACLAGLSIYFSAVAGKGGISDISDCFDMMAGEE